MKHAVNFGLFSKYRSELMGVFCIWVILHHSRDVCTYPSFLQPLRQLFVIGHLGVEAFLILSGIGLYFAYSKLKATEPRTGRRLSQFYWRRFVRLFIPYLLFAAPYFAWVAWGRTHQGIGRFLSDFFQLSFPMRNDRVVWYVTALALFYLLFPIIYYFQYKPLHFRGEPVKPETVTAWLYLAAVAMCFIIMKLSPKLYGNIEIMLGRLPAFILGCLLGKWVKEKKPIPTYLVPASFVFIVIYTHIFAPMISYSKLHGRLTGVLYAMAALIFLSWVFFKLDHCTKTRKFFSFCGERSLELYLSHILLRRVWLDYPLSKDLWDPWGALSYLCIVAAAVVVSVILHPVIGWLSKKLVSIGGAPKAAA